MPFTPIHWSIAYLARKIRPSLSLPALIVSTATPDIEIPFIYLITSGRIDRLVLHSLLGAATLATLLSVVFTVFAYAPLVSHLFKLDGKTVRERCRFSLSLVLVCLLGNLSHVLIDALNHEYNPLLFPFTYTSFDAFVFVKDLRIANVIVPIAFLALLIFFVFREVRRGTKNIWERLFVE